MALNINGTTGISGVDGSASAPALQGTDSNTGINFGSDTVNINTGGTTKATVDSNGRLGIGTTSPNRVVEINNSQPCIRLTNGTNGFDIGTGGFVDGSNSLIFYDEGVGERMRLDSSGNLLVGTTSTAPAQSGTTTGIALKNSGRAEIDAGNSVSIVVNRTNTGDIQQFRRNTLVKGEIHVNASRVAYQTTSDYRLKENITTLSNGITRLKSLKPSRFNFKEDPSNTMDGFIAHELQTVIPEAVSGTKDEVDSEGKPKYQGVDTSFVVPLLTAALQEAVAKIEVLETKVAALEAG